MRFERDTGSGFERVFAETFSFHPDRHDPAELYLQLEDILSRPRLISPDARPRDAERVVIRLIAALPRYAEAAVYDLQASGRIDGPTLGRVWEDMALLVQVADRIVADKRLEDRPELRVASLHLRKLGFRAHRELVARRVRPELLARYRAGELEPLVPDDPSESALHLALVQQDPETLERCLLGLAERDFYRWLEGVCLDETDQAFETEGSPFESRELEVLRAVSATADRRLDRGRDVTPFLRRPGNKDCLRVLGKLEAWFLRQYDIHHGAVVIRHAHHLARGEDDAERMLSRQRPRNHLLALAALVAPFAAGAMFYERAPRLFDWVAGLEVLGVLGVTFWFMIWRFWWQRDLTFFHASVPRIQAGIIVGYLPVFLLDEVWDLARGSWYPLVAVMALLGFTTLLYLYVEVRGRIGDSSEAFARAQGLFLLGLLEAFAVGLVVTSLLGPFMATRNWSPTDDVLPMDVLRATVPPSVGELPPILGVAPLFAFPTAVILFSFLSFFIGTFIQLLWEELPITEPL